MQPLLHVAMEVNVSISPVFVLHVINTRVSVSLALHTLDEGVNEVRYTELRAIQFAAITPPDKRETMRGTFARLS